MPGRPTLRATSADVLPPFLAALPTRVRRAYAGGALLDHWTHTGPGRDTDEPEDWIASTTPAQNPGLAPRAGEGITRLVRPDGHPSDLAREIQRAPEHWLGAAHVRAHGLDLGFLAKLLDSAMRLHIQAHPTAAFAREHLNSPHGKLEVYAILGARDGGCPYALLGFKRAVERAEWRRIIAEQDVAAMEACLHRVPLAPGEIWLVPGGLPHAIGAGVLMLEVMEPSDWVVRCEFEREGLVVPPSARFMGRDLDFCLNVFDFTAYTAEELRHKCRIEPRRIADAPSGTVEELIGPAHTDCFALQRLHTQTRAPLPSPGRFRAVLITVGTGTLRGGGIERSLQPGSRWLIPAASIDCTVEPVAGGTMEAMVCTPG